MSCFYFLLCSIGCVRNWQSPLNTEIFIDTLMILGVVNFAVAFYAVFN